MDIPLPLHKRSLTCHPILEVRMSQTALLAVGLDSTLLATQRPIWQSAGYLITDTESIREAILHINARNFDLVLLGHSIPTESRERLTFLIRASSSRIPVVCVSPSSSHHDRFADATIREEPDSLLRGIQELLAKQVGARTAGATA
jgi:DNA-binding NtrC family response regulator